MRRWLEEFWRKQKDQEEVEGWRLILRRWDHKGLLVQRTDGWCLLILAAHTCSLVTTSSFLPYETFYNSPAFDDQQKVLNLDLSFPRQTSSPALNLFHFPSNRNLKNPSSIQLSQHKSLLDLPWPAYHFSVSAPSTIKAENSSQSWKYFREMREKSSTRTEGNHLACENRKEIFFCYSCQFFNQKANGEEIKEIVYANFPFFRHSIRAILIRLPHFHGGISNAAGFVCASFRLDVYIIGKWNLSLFVCKRYGWGFVEGMLLMARAQTEFIARVQCQWWSVEIYCRSLGCAGDTSSASFPLNLIIENSNAIKKRHTRALNSSL